ncbi:MAG TPA: hypothetical protein VF316_00960, partial [Polyangiaceae bacterium]
MARPVDGSTVTLNTLVGTASLAATAGQDASMEASTRDFEARFIALAAEWRALNAPLPAPSEGRFAELRTEAQAI